MRITPSILNADFARLGDEIARIPSADAIHVDVMDYHFVPNMTFGLPMVEALRAATTTMLDIHLMIAEPDRWALSYAEAGAESVTFHAEAAKAPVRLARELRAKGARAGLALNPGTAIDHYAGMLGEVDMILLMTVEPGFGGQALIASTLNKVRELDLLRRGAGLPFRLQVDGGINAETAHLAVAAGADVLVAGNAVFAGGDIGGNLKQLYAALQPARA